MGGKSTKFNGDALSHSESDYGHRLIPQVIDASADEDPARLVGMITKSTDVSQGFNTVTIGNVAHAVNYMPFWMEKHVGRGGRFETVAYLVSTNFP
jgi:hypothetical protein